MKAGSDSPRGQPLVVCVDDEPEILSSLWRLLRREPYDLLMTGEPDEALRWVETREVDLVISDQRMAPMLGSALLGEVRRRSPRTARVLLTGYPGASVALLAKKLDLQDLILKPWNGSRLKVRIRRLLGLDTLSGSGATGAETRG